VNVLWLLSYKHVFCNYIICRIVCFVNRAPLYNLVNKAKSVQNFSQYVYIFSLHVSGDYVPIIRRNNCIYVTLGICHSVWMNLWSVDQTVIRTE